LISDLSFRKSIAIAIALFMSNLAQTQVFEDVSNLFNSFDEITAGGCFAGCGVSFYDFNNDGLDDLSFAGLDTDIRLFENIGGSFIEIESIPNSDEAKHILWADIDNDGDADLFVSKYQAQCRLYLNDGDGSLTDITEQCGLPLNTGQENYGACFGDYDRDGFLDLYICNYNSVEDETVLSNYLLKNNGNGTFSDVTDAAGVSNGVKLSLGAVWVDYNKDLWPDLFVFNDKSNFENALYLNQGNGTFSDVSDFTGTNQAINAMSGTTGDYNNDGWLDIYVSNGPIVGNLLLKNNNGFSFADHAAIAGVQTYDMCWSAQWIDYDNNMWQDLYVAVRDWDALPTENHFYINEGNGSFTHDLGQTHFPGDDKIGWSNAVGDIDGDGYQDLVQFTDEASTLGLWKNGGGNAHYIKIDLTGVVSNTDGIGTRIECHAGGITQTRYTYCGEDYLAQDSQHEIIGLADQLEIDSLTVFWPSGVIDHYYNLPVDQHIELIEGNTLQAELNYSGLIQLCDGDTIEISVGDYEEYYWSNGSTESTFLLSSDESVWVEVVNEFGLTLVSNTIEVEIIPVPEFSSTTTDITCFGLADGSAAIDFDDDVFDLLWEDGLTDSVHTALGYGVHLFTIADPLLFCPVTDSIFINQPTPISFEEEISHILCFGDSTGMIELMLSGGTGEIVVDWMEIDPMGMTAGEYAVMASDSNNCEITIDWEIEQPSLLTSDIEAVWQDDEYVISSNPDGGSPPYEFLWSDDTEDETIVNPDEGEYWVQVTDTHDCIHLSDVFTFTDMNEHKTSQVIVSFNSINHSVLISQIPSKVSRIELWDAAGRLINTQFPSGPTMEFDCSDLTKGVYMLHFTGLTTSQTKRILVH
jgi:hypothetical protein